MFNVAPELTALAQAAPVPFMVGLAFLGMGLARVLADWL
jgi:hypothetical protein